MTPFRNMDGNLDDQDNFTIYIKPLIFKHSPEVISYLIFLKFSPLKAEL